jgi:hypothetical protein
LFVVKIGRLMSFQKKKITDYHIFYENYISLLSYANCSVNCKFVTGIVLVNVIYIISF